MFDYSVLNEDEKKQIVEYDLYFQLFQIITDYVLNRDKIFLDENIVNSYNEILEKLRFISITLYENYYNQRGYSTFYKLQNKGIEEIKKMAMLQLEESIENNTLTLEEYNSIKIHILNMNEYDLNEKIESDLKNNYEKNKKAKLANEILRVIIERFDFISLAFGPSTVIDIEPTGIFYKTDSEYNDELYFSSNMFNDIIEFKDFKYLKDTRENIEDMNDNFDGVFDGLFDEVFTEKNQKLIHDNFEETYVKYMDIINSFYEINKSLNDSYLVGYVEKEIDNKIDISFISDNKLKQIIEKEYLDILACYQNNTFKYCYYGIISIIEVVLIYALKKYKDEAYDLCEKHNKKISEKDISRWGVPVLLKISKEIGLIEPYIQDIFNDARDSRNNIHLWKLKYIKLPEYSKKKINYLLQFLTEFIKAVKNYIDQNSD